MYQPSTAEQAFDHLSVKIIPTTSKISEHKIMFQRDSWAINTETHGPRLAKVIRATVWFNKQHTYSVKTHTSLSPIMQQLFSEIWLANDLECPRLLLLALAQFVHVCHWSCNGLLDVGTQLRHLSIPQSFTTRQWGSHHLQTKTFWLKLHMGILCLILR